MMHEWGGYYGDHSLKILDLKSKLKSIGSTLKN